MALKRCVLIGNPFNTYLLEKFCHTWDLNCREIGKDGWLIDALLSAFLPLLQNDFSFSSLLADIGVIDCTEWQFIPNSCSHYYILFDNNSRVVEVISSNRSKPLKKKVTSLNLGKPRIKLSRRPLQYSASFLSPNLLQRKQSSSNLVRFQATPFHSQHFPSEEKYSQNLSNAHKRRSLYRHIIFHINMCSRDLHWRTFGPRLPTQIRLLPSSSSA